MKKVLAIIFVSVVALGCSSSKVECGLYSWEMQRDSIPQFSDISLLAGGYSVKKPDT